MNRKKRDHLLFEELTFCYMKQLFRLAVGRVGNTADAEDIVQETYLKAYRAFDSFKHQADTKTWLTRILINTANDHLRKVVRTNTVVQINGDLEEHEEPTEKGPEDLLCDSEFDPELMNALKTIPEPFLTPLILREIHDATYDDIARILELPKGTVMSRLSRAREMLRNSLSASRSAQPVPTLSRNKKGTRP